MRLWWLRDVVVFRSKLTMVIVIALAIIVSACSTQIEIPHAFPTPPPATASEPLGGINLKRDAALEAQISKIAEMAKGKVGVAAVMIETGDAALLNRDERFPMQSVYKLPISMAVLEQVRLGKLELDEKIGVSKEDFVRPGMRSPLRDANPNGGEFTIRELIRLSMVESDGTASDVLMRVAGGAQPIQDYLTQIGIDGVRVVNTEKEIGRDWQTQYTNYATPTQAAELLRWLNAAAWDTHSDDGIQRPLEENDAPVLYQLLLKFMADSNPGSKRIKGELPSRTFVAHKTGTSGTQNGITAATNDIGVFNLENGQRVALAVFVSDSPADEKIREGVIAKIAKAVWDAWSLKPGKGAIDININSLSLGASYAEIVKKLGLPTKVVREEYNDCAQKNGLTLLYPGLRLYLLGIGRIERFSIASVEIESGDWSASGIAIGATAAQVIEQLGEPRSGVSGDKTLYYTIRPNDGGINVDFDNGAVAKISFKYTLC